jgi:RES domain-containing protein
MILYRLALKEHADDLSGEGARRDGGRWNPPGTAVIYTSENLPLAVLEILVNVPQEFLADNSQLFYKIHIQVPDNASITVIDELPNDWRSCPPPAALAQIGYEWAKENKTLLLKVPSAVAGEDNCNYLINPLHPEFNTVRIIRNEPFKFDIRLIRPEPPEPIDFESRSKKIKARKKKA